MTHIVKITALALFLAGSMAMTAGAKDHNSSGDSASHSEHSGSGTHSGSGEKSDAAERNSASGHDTVDGTDASSDGSNDTSSDNQNCETSRSATPVCATDTGGDLGGSQDSTGTLRK